MCSTELSNVYRHPLNGTRLISETDPHGDINALLGKDGVKFFVSDGIPDLIWPRTLEASERQAQSIYEEVADVYDKYIHLTFDTFRADEITERTKMVERLHLQSGQTVLEFGCGTGRTTALLAEWLGASGQIFLQELARPVLVKAREKAQQLETPTEVALANGSYLPMADNSVDAVFHFGGLNMFSEIDRCLREAVRVTKPGGRVVIGDENMPIWLRETEMGRVLMNSNPHYRCPVPFEHIPVEARDVTCEWIIGGVFYVISFTVGEGEPYADLDFDIPGRRGGTHRTRYYGQLEGVSPEAKQRAQEQAQKSGVSLHTWLDQLIKASSDTRGGEL
ncbi:class I SAM-dependent methyltransferase [Thiorhodovibrio litoralis]|uniref:class I SAM-dependent methyltransferase n=1 Tax=Thiorhodovibrio litoralis TaxID=2952932 RepID=UPI002B2580F8|nr:methyltransferase domain-containing protein [Thiorhodovibrio litoralis]WPL14173.1 Ubiquinone/menaquinone biosynthesis methyltransferase ubiE [Thiorhodovibrio litoralis]